jgi:hypothetical protein
MGPSHWRSFRQLTNDFKAMDSNKDGKLTLEEMQAFIHGTR